MTAALLGLGAAGCGGGSGGGSPGGAGGEGGDSGEPALFSISDAEVKEGDVGAKDLSFKVKLSHALGDVAKVAYSTVDDTAVATGATANGGRDYEAASATLRFEAGETEQTIDITINGDHKVEADESFQIKLSKPLGASIEHIYGTGTILNDDSAPLPKLTIADAQVVEGNTGSRDAALILTLSQASDTAVSVDYATQDGTALDGEDYTAVQGTLTFAPGQTQQIVSVPVLGDTLAEPEESLTVTLANPHGATLGAAMATLTIGNDDVAGPTLSIGDVTTSEGSVGSKSLTFTLSLSPASPSSVSVDYATIDQSASASGVASAGGRDFAASSDSVTFAPGETSKQVKILVNGDTLNEPDETFAVELSNAVGATVVDAQGIGTISNDDAQPSISISDPSVLEGAAGTRTASFSVSLSAASGRSVSVNYATANVTATAGTDYQASSGKLTFQPGQSIAYVSVLVTGDTLDEDDETFSVSLSGALNASITDAQGVGTILDDDDMPRLAINDVALAEGNTGTKNAVFDVTLSAASGRDVTVAWATNAVSAAAGQDFVTASGTLDFPPGTTSRSVTIAIAGDALDEPNETFTVDLASPSHASLNDGQGLGTIINDDSTLPGLSIADASVGEANAGTVTLSLAVTLSAPSAQQVQVNYQTLDDMAVSNADFQATSGTLTFSAGQTQKTVDITVNADALDELDETLYVTLSGAVNAFVADGVGLGTILNDDAPPSLSIDDVTLTEGNLGKKNAIFTISLSAVSGISVGVSYATADGTAVEAGTASSGQDDYDAASDTVFIPAGQSSVQISVPINGDTLTESAETFQVILSAPQNATLADATGQCSISNDDALPSIAISDVAAPEGDAGTKAFTFTLTLSAVSGNTVSVDFATANGTAFSGQDYNAASGTVTFAPGQTTATLDVMVLGDTAVEGHKDETFSVSLTNAQGATLSDALGAAIIQDDD